MTGFIPRPFIDELLNRLDIVELIDAYVPLKKRGNSYVACCPFHHEKTPSFNVVAKKQFYHCFGCGASGNAISFMMNYSQLGFVEAIESLATRAGMSVPREATAAHHKPTPNLYQLLDRVTQFFQQQLKTNAQEAIQYLKTRQISGEIAQRYQIGYAPSGWHTLETAFKSHKNELITTGMLVVKENGTTYDRYRHRITFPIHNRNGHVVGFGGRVLDSSQQPKYLNSPETILFQKNRELYGLHQVLQQDRSNDCIIIVEGYMDVIALAQHGICNAVATLGTATTPHHLQLLTKHTRELVFCFDGDSAGKQAAWRALENSLPQMNQGLEAKFIFLPDGQDPDSLVRTIGQAKFLELIHEATPLNEFFFSSLGKNIDSTSWAGKSQLVNAAKPYLLKMVDGPYKQLMFDQLARVTRIESHRLIQLIEENSTETTLDPGVNISRSPIRLAIAMLLQHPEIYPVCASQLPASVLDGIQQDVLKTLVQHLAQNPEMKTAALVECWRDSPLFDSINKLAAWDHQVPEGALAKEFSDIMLFLSKKNEEDKIQQLLNKARTQGLTEPERKQLQTMLKQRHQKLPQKG